MIADDKKRYLVVGASKGIGKAITQKLDADGHHVIGVSRNFAKCKHWFQADVTTDEGLDAIAAQVGEKLDALVFVAGAWEEHAFSDEYNFLNSARSETQKIVALNLIAPILLAQALAVPLSQANSPKIILMGSTSGLDSCHSKEVAYTASKFGLRGVSQSLAIALKPLRIDVSIINPGDVATPEVIRDCKEHKLSTAGLIPMKELIRTVDLILEGSSHAVHAEINLFDQR